MQRNITPEAARRRSKRGPLSIDEHVGNRLKVRRTLAGMSQTELGGRVGITFQQIQKYEKGVNRISAGHLFLFARTLDCSLADFFEGLDGEVDAVPLITSEQDARLLQAFARLDENAREAVFDFVQALQRPKPGRK
jgi:transcriptional regulator with XRE-family HTH domain